MKPARTEPLTANEQALKCWLESRVDEEVAKALTHAKAGVASGETEHAAKAKAFQEVLDWWFK